MKAGIQLPVDQQRQLPVKSHPSGDPLIHALLVANRHGDPDRRADAEAVAFGTLSQNGMVSGCTRAWPVR